jgi:CIC family chloride channel protein
MKLREILQYVSDTDHTDFPVIDDNDRLTGMISVQDFRAVLFERDLEDLIVAKELVTEVPPRLTPDGNLAQALTHLSACHFDHLPVVDPTDERRVVALVSRADVMRAYHRALAMR